MSQGSHPNPPQPFLPRSCSLSTCISLSMVMEMGCRGDLTLQQGPCCRAGDLGFRQCYTPGRNIHTPNLPPPYFLVARCLCSPSQDLQSTWHVTASRESQDNFPPSPRLAFLQILLFLPSRPQLVGCNHRISPRGVPRGQHNPRATCRAGACQGRSRARGDAYSSPWVAPALQGDLLRHSSHAQSQLQCKGTRGTELRGPTALGSPGQSHTLQGRHSTNTAPQLPLGCRQQLRSRGNHQSSKKSNPVCPHAACLTPESPGASGCSTEWAQSLWDQPRSCLSCLHRHPTANLTKPTSTGAVPALGQGPKHGHCSHGTHTPHGWGCTGHTVGAVTSQPQPCTEMGHIQHPWPEIPEKAPQLMIMAEPFPGAEIDPTLHRSCAGRGGEHRASSSCVT